MNRSTTSPPSNAHPDWTALVGARNAGDEPAGWTAALDHMDACEPCRRRALALDPLLVFRRLEPSDAAETAPSEAESMKAAVAAMRSARRVGSTVTPLGSATASGGGRWTSWRRMAAAAVLVATLAGGSTLLLGPFSSEVAPAPVGAAGVVTSAAVPTAPVATAAEAPPLVENLDRPDADVLHLGGEEMAVVMILDAGLDV